MTMKARVLWVAMVVVAALWSTGCGHYDCGITKGSTTCSTGSSSTTKSGGNGNPTGDAFIYVATAGGIQGMTLTVSAGTIADNCTPATCPVVPNVAAKSLVIAQKKYIYVSYPSTGQIYGWTIATDGSLTFLNGGSPYSASYMIGSTLGGTQSMIVNPAGNLLFNLDVSANTVYVYTIGSNGTLAPAAVPSYTLPFEPVNLAMDGLGKYLYISSISNSTTSGQLAAYSVGTGGTLTSVSGSPFTFSAGGDPGYSVVQMQGDASGKYLLGITPNFLNPDTHIYVMSISSTGVPTSVTGSPFTTTYAPVYLSVQTGGTGNLVYSFSLNSKQLPNSIEGYQLNASSGALTASSGSPFATTGSSAMFEQSGKYIFVTGTSALDVFDVTKDPGLSQPVASVGWGGEIGDWSPTDIP